MPVRRKAQAMAATTDNTMDAADLQDSDKAILNQLAQGRATKGYLVDNTDYTRNTIYNRLNVLEAAGHVTCIHEPTRLFELNNDPRDAQREHQ
jgi:DeoR/GlpR family transcriptional regulator of sugar metabolism